MHSFKAYHVKDASLAARGRDRTEWAKKSMPVLSQIESDFHRQKPLKGRRVSACLHVTTETAVLMQTLKAGGADVALCASNPLSTQDDTAAYLAKGLGIRVYAIKGENRKTYYDHLRRAVDHKPEMTMDDGADLVSMIHSKNGENEEVIGGTEETTTGVIRLRSMAQSGVLRYPIIAVNDANTKHLFDNRYGTGQSTLDGIIRATNRLLAGATFVVAGYGLCGRGVAMRARGLGANVVVTEVSPLMALEAVMDGFRVMSMGRAAKEGDFFCTVTGNTHVLRQEHFQAMKDGAILANSGHFNVEIDIPALEKLSKSTRTIRDYVVEYTLRNGRRLYLLAEGRLVNLAAAEGHPSSVMDMSFANQALSARYMAEHAEELAPEVIRVPEEIDSEIARLKLKSLGVNIDGLTPEQKKYLSSWEEGT
ncbi:MAG: adenosylhomocysteinase [Nitrospirae bacterium]|nr:adenosylhomocysteinase [Nitrospirota bacterium]